MTNYEYDEYQEVMIQALNTMNKLLDVFEPKKEKEKNKTITSEEKICR